MITPSGSFEILSSPIDESSDFFQAGCQNVENHDIVDCKNSKIIIIIIIIKKKKNPIPTQYKRNHSNNKLNFV
uniref:Uncharacterized protein n=1 Tax=Cannabis sativa TaxID=3483 RepID=A0A803R4L8_CANSA